MTPQLLIPRAEATCMHQISLGRDGTLLTPTGPRVDITWVAHLHCDVNIVRFPKDRYLTDVVVVPRGALCPRCLAPLKTAVYRLRSRFHSLNCGVTRCFQLLFHPLVASSATSSLQAPTYTPDPPSRLHPSHISYTRSLHESVNQ